MESSLKLLDYLARVSKQPITVDGDFLISKPVRRVTLNESFFFRDDCEMCGRCCLNETNVWTAEGERRINLSRPSDFEKWGLDFSVISELKERIQTKVHVINGSEVLFRISPRDPEKEAFILGWEDRKAQPRCHWLFEKDGTYRCRIHPIRSVTCGMPHCRMYYRRSTNSTTIGVSQYGRNWALKCPVKFGSIDEESVQSRILWLRRLNAVAEDCGITTWLPDILEYLESGNRTPFTFENSPRRKLFTI